MIIRRATEADYDGYFSVKSDKQLVIWGGYKSAPDYEIFKNVYLTRLADANRKEYICIEGEQTIGYLATFEEHGEIEISYGVIESFTGRGIASSLIHRAIQDEQGKIVTAWVSEENKGSEKCLMNNGFVKTQTSRMQYLPLFGKEHQYYKWERKFV